MKMKVHFEEKERRSEGKIESECYRVHGYLNNRQKKISA